MIRRGLWLAVVCALLSLLVSSCSFLGIGSSSKLKVPSAKVSVFHLRVGECLNPPSTIEAQVTSLSVVPCRAPHTEQVYAFLQDHAGDNYPGATALEKFANAECLQHFASYVGIDYQDSSLFYTYLLPSVASWAQSDRTVVCFVTTTGQRLTESVKGSRR